MALFVVQHEHAAESCPASDPQMGAMLLNHLSRPNVRRHGIEILGEAVIDAEHSLYMIVEASDRGLVDEFMKPFAMVGTVDSMPLQPASESWRAVAAGSSCRRSRVCRRWMQRKRASGRSTPAWSSIEPI